VRRGIWSFSSFLLFSRSVYFLSILFFFILGGMRTRSSPSISGPSLRVCVWGGHAFRASSRDRVVVLPLSAEDYPLLLIVSRPPMFKIFHLYPVIATCFLILAFFFSLFPFDWHSATGPMSPSPRLNGLTSNNPVSSVERLSAFFSFAFLFPVQTIGRRASEPMWVSPAFFSFPPKKRRLFLHRHRSPSTLFLLRRSLYLQFLCPPLWLDVRVFRALTNVVFAAIFFLRDVS